VDKGIRLKAEGDKELNSFLAISPLPCAFGVNMSHPSALVKPI
jgi:hypothetical protein